MTDTLPPLPALQHHHEQASMFERLSQFQAIAASKAPVPCDLLSVLAAALPAFQLGFAYTASHWRGELTVTLHYRGAELGSSAAAPIVDYSQACACLLAGLLGIPVTARPAEPEGITADIEAAMLSALTAEVVDAELLEEPQPAAQVASTVAEPAVASEQPSASSALEDVADGDAIDVLQPLTPEEVAAAIATVKSMEPDIRRAFTKAFRETFQVPAEAKAIIPLITQMQHLLFVDRYCTEAAGGIAAA